jgi:hypothetical protein
LNPEVPMHRRYVAVIVLGVVSMGVMMGVSASGCSPPQEKVEADTGSLRTGELPCEVNRVLTTVCQQCHEAPPINDAPFSLVTYADTQTNVNGAPIYKYMLTALQAGRMPAQPVQLEADDRAILISWLRAGAPPRETDSCVADAAPEVDAGPPDAQDAAETMPDVESDADSSADVCADAEDVAVVHVDDACTTY